MRFWTRLFGKYGSASEPLTESDKFRRILKSLTPGDWSALPNGPQSNGPYIKYTSLEVLAVDISAEAVIALLNARGRDARRGGLRFGSASLLHFYSDRRDWKVGFWLVREWSDGHPQDGNSFNEWSEEIAVLRQRRDKFTCVTWTKEIYNRAEY